MKDHDFMMGQNKIVNYLKKPAVEFIKTDIIRYIEENNIPMVNFRYVAGDGRLKQLNLIINNKKHLEEVLSFGERVDGSSLFPFVDCSSSDLYVIPRFKTAFVNPFTAIPTVDILCSFYNYEGKPLESAPEYILKKAQEQFKKSTGMTFKALGELEYYVIKHHGPQPSAPQELYSAMDQKGYHESAPFAKYEEFRREALSLITQCGGLVKYAHSEVGNFKNEYAQYEQNEIEFLPTAVEDAADQLIIGKWVLRMLGHKYGVNITLAPKITIGKAGSGLHFHMLLEKDGKNMLVNENGLSDIAKKAIAGVLDLSASLTAFGNTIPTSYLRLVPHQEAPTNICWGDRNRSVLVRVPLGWTNKNDMIQDANPLEKVNTEAFTSKQTFEFRAPDGSADIYLTLAALVVAVTHGLEKEDSLKVANELYVAANIFKTKGYEDKFKKLPVSCYQSAEALDQQRDYYEKNNIFPKGTIDAVIAKLKAYNDSDLSERLFGKSEEIKKLVDQFLHCM